MVQNLKFPHISVEQY